MGTMLWLHTIVMVLSLVFEIVLFGRIGVLIGLGAIMVLLALIGCAVLPVAYVIGWLAHCLFSQTTIPVEMAVRVLALLFEANLFAWVVMLSIWPF